MEWISVKLSIVTITRNQQEYLTTAIHSVLSARVTNLQYIIYDAVSTDGTSEIIAQIDDPRVESVQRRDEGPADGLNNALRLVDGDLFGYINGDDFYLPGALEWVIKYFEKHQKVDMIHGGGLIVDAQGNSGRRVFPRPYSPRLAALGASFVFQQATFFRTKSIRDLRFNPANHTCWDGEFVRDLALRGAVMRREPVMLGAFRLHPGSISGGPPNPSYLLDRQRLMRETLNSPVRRSQKVSANFLRGIFYAEGMLRGPGMRLAPGHD